VVMFEITVVKVVNDGSSGADDISESCAPDRSANVVV
jgi:hypothetical protein